MKFSYLYIRLCYFCMLFYKFLNSVQCRVKFRIRWRRYQKTTLEVLNWCLTLTNSITKLFYYFIICFAVPYHTVQCRLNQGEECYNSFELDYEIFEIRVKVGGSDLDRDTKKANYTCTLTCTDNPNNEQSMYWSKKKVCFLLLYLVEYAEQLFFRYPVFLMVLISRFFKITIIYLTKA